MKTESNNYPEQVTVELNGDVILTENITEIMRDEQTVYQYDSYRINTVYRDGLKERIEASFADWLDYAKVQESKPTPEEIAQADQTLKVVDVLIEVGLL